MLILGQFKDKFIDREDQSIIYRKVLIPPNTITSSRWEVRGFGHHLEEQ